MLPISPEANSSPATEDKSSEVTKRKSPHQETTSDEDEDDITVVGGVEASPSSGSKVKGESSKVVTRSADKKKSKQQLKAEQSMDITSTCSGESSTDQHKDVVRMEQTNVVKEGVSSSKGNRPIIPMMMSSLLDKLVASALTSGETGPGGDAQGRPGGVVIEVPGPVVDAQRKVDDDGDDDDDEVLDVDDSDEESDGKLENMFFKLDLST